MLSSFFTINKLFPVAIAVVGTDCTYGTECGTWGVWADVAYIWSQAKSGVKCLILGTEVFLNLF